MGSKKKKNLSLLHQPFILQLRVCPRSQCVSTVSVRTDLFKRDPNKVLLTDFFGSVRNVELLTETVQLDNFTSENTCR